MSWVKRHLFFLIGSLIAVALLAAAGWYLFGNLEENNDKRNKLHEAYTELKRLNELKPHPGKGKVDNIKIAKEQEAELRAFIRKAAAFFKPIPAIPENPNFTTLEFTESLRRTISQLTAAAQAGSVTLPPRYSFSFEAQKNEVTFAPGSLPPLAVQLGEVKTICDVLFRAKINQLDGIRRERVSANDLAQTASLSDYHERKSVTNELGVFTTYEVSFRCFTPELAATMAGFASSPHGLIVKGVAVEPAAPSSTTLADMTAPPVAYTPPQPVYVQPPPSVIAQDRYAERPVAGKGFAPPPTAPAPPPTIYTPPAPAAATRSKTVIDERPLRVTLLIELMKLRPK